MRNTARKGVQDFNSHAHVERDQSDALYTQMVGNFNSHAHVERDCHLPYPSRILHISTHTLTWSVTHSSIHTIFTPFISTHTLTWSVTIDAAVKTALNGISTHTLTWSVTG